MQNSGLLKKYYRQPKLYISLPSKGEYYNHTLAGDPSNIPVYGMSAMDEIMFKTPDALFSGDAIVNVIQSCVPTIKDPWIIPQLDIDVILIGIRMATYGSKLPMSFTCKECKEKNEIDFDLQNALNYFDNLSYNPFVYCDPLTIKLRPYTYREYTNLQLEIYQTQQELNNSKDLDKNLSVMNEFYKKLAKIQANSLKLQIDYVEAENEKVNDTQEILDWINNSEIIFFESIKAHLDEQRNTWKIQNQTSQCHNCGIENSLTISLDNSNFFVKK